MLYIAPLFFYLSCQIFGERAVYINMNDIFYELAGADGLASYISQSYTGDTAKLFRDAKDAVKVFENGKEGLRLPSGEILIPAIFVQVELCRNFIFLRAEIYQWRIFASGGIRGEKITENKPEGMLFARNGKVGWRQGGEEVIAPLYDDVHKWPDADVYFTQSDETIRYFILSGDRTLKAFTQELYLFSHSPDSIILRTLADEPNDRDVMVYRGLPVRLKIESRQTILERFSRPGRNVLAMAPDGLDGFKSAFSYEFAAYEVVSHKSQPMQDCLRQLRQLNVFLNTWRYILDIRISSESCLKFSDLRAFRRYFERQDTGVITMDTQILIDDQLPPDTVQIFLATFYTDHWFPTTYEQDWEYVCSKENSDHLMDALEEVLAELLSDRNNDYAVSLEKEMKKYAYSFVSYEPERDIKETFKVLDLLRDTFHPNLTGVAHAAYELIWNVEYGDLEMSPEEVAFYYNKSLWLMQNGANPSERMDDGLTVVEALEGQKDNPDCRALLNLCREYGGKTSEELLQIEDTELFLEQELARWRK